MNQQAYSPSRYKQYKSLSFSEHFSDEEMARDWTLSESDLKEITRYRKNARLYIAIQICCVRLYGRFFQRINDLSVRVINYLNAQLGLPANLSVDISSRKATLSIYRNNVLTYLGFNKFDESSEKRLGDWLTEKARLGILPDQLFLQSQAYLLDHQILLPGPSLLDKLIARICSEVHLGVFETVYQKLPGEILKQIEAILKLPEGEQRTFFYRLKEYPPSASISSLKNYLNKYQRLMDMGVDKLEQQLVEPAFQQYLYELPVLIVCLQ